MSDGCSAPVSYGLRRLVAIAALSAATVTGSVAVTAVQGRAAPPTSVIVRAAMSTSPVATAAPTALVATSVTSASVTLTWTAPTGACCPVTGYDISYHQAFGHLVWTANVGNVTTTTITSNITRASEYTFSVVARYSTGQRSSPSNAVTVVTPVSDRGPDTTPPQAPTDLAATAATPAGAVLTWSPSTDNVGVVAYTVFLFDGSFIPRHVTTVPGTTYTVPPSVSATRFYVRARDAAGNVSLISSAPIPPPSTSPPTSSSVSPLACRVTYEGLAEWKSGFVAGLTITNTGTAPVNGWTLTFIFGGDQHVASSWSATFRQSGPTVTMKHAVWNGALAPGRSALIGMQGTWTASNAPPSAFALNGVACAAG